MGGQWCFNCGEDRPVRYEAVYTPSAEGVALHLVICEACARDMDAEAFTRLALDNLPSVGGTVEVVNHPADQVARDGALPENQ
jgi:hypothetical protein